MDEMKRSMKYSVILGICGAIAIPLLYELYANISKDGALVLFAAYMLFAGVKFSSLRAKEALVGITAAAAYSVILALPLFMIVHPRVKSFLTRRSKYFSLTFAESADFFAKIALMLTIMYLVWAARAGFTAAFKKFRSNGEKAGSYIENAFDDSKEEEDL